jgi:DNA-binding transcriptional LysR family regulator
MSAAMQTLRLFSDVARCHSFSLAASLHGISQSAASQRIGQLEKKLGVTLIDRSVRPLAMTDAGRVFLAGVGDVLQRYDRLERAVMAKSARPTGTVRVSAIYSSGIDLLGRARAQFEASRPGLSVQIDYEKPDAVHAAVVEGRVDVGILSYPERFKKVAAVPLRDEVMAVVCPEDHPLAGRRSVEAGELSGLEMVGFDLDLPVGRRIAAYLKEHGAAPVTAHSFDNLDTLKSAVVATGRFAILPRRTVRPEVSAGTLVCVELEPTLVRPMGLIYRRTLRQQPGLSPGAAVFVDFLLDHARQDEPPQASAAELETTAAAKPKSVIPQRPLAGSRR